MPPCCRRCTATVDWRAVKQYLVEEGVAVPPRAPSRIGTQPRAIDPFVGVVEASLRHDITVKGRVIRRHRLHARRARQRPPDQLPDAARLPIHQRSHQLRDVWLDTAAIAAQFSASTEH
jgi:hypothetical protein